jgi:hypothetical protein
MNFLLVNCKSIENESAYISLSDVLPTHICLNILVAFEPSYLYSIGMFIWCCSQEGKNLLSFIPLSLQDVLVHIQINMADRKMFYIAVLSANGETKTVWKGITHGACDYLLKPVRLEELKNIWQHVLRRRFSHRERNPNLCTDDPESDKLPNSNQSHAQGQHGQNSSSDDSGRHSKKRKDQNEPEEEGEEDNGLDDEEHDQSTQKKPRVVWSVELHRKFVAAVNQLGIDSKFS